MVIFKLKAETQPVTFGARQSHRAPMILLEQSLGVEDLEEDWPTYKYTN